MKKLASVSADIYHKHYADNAYVNAHQSTNLNQVHIVTYTHYKQLQGAGCFLNMNFFRKCKAPRAIVGIGGLGFDLRYDVFEKQLKAFIKYLPKHVELYVHAACHVKMLSYDSVTALGSQNISPTSLPYLDAQASPIARHHEVQVEFQDHDLTCARAIFDEILCDPSLHLKLSRKSIASEVIAHLLKGFSFEVHKINMSIAHALGNFLDTDTSLPNGLNSIPRLEEKQNLISLAQHIYTAGVVTDAQVNDLFEILYAECDDCPLGETFTDKVFEISRMLELVNETSLPEKNIVLPILRSIYSKEMLLVDGEELSELIDELKNVIEQYSVTDRREFAARHQDSLVQQIIENPDFKQKAISNTRDNDGNLIEDKVRQALLAGTIDFRGYEEALDLSDFIFALHEVIESSYIAVVSNTFDRIRRMHTKLLDVYQRELSA
ncbi:hypothetical protein [Pseudomonas syringae group genomosp. 3]|nr:hypothetical protein [Pseudomonas syringae group genomosp. 3]